MFGLRLILIACLLHSISTKDLPKSDVPAEVVIHATNKTSIPSVHYVVDAVECLKQAFAVYTESADRAQLYAELFQEKHNETGWNVVAGYTAAYIKSKWYVETSVTNGGKNKDAKKDKGDKETSTLYLIFSTV